MNTTTTFDRDGMARWYAERHRRADPGIRAICYLPRNAPEREIRLVEVNDLIAEGNGAALEPIDFGVDVGTDAHHTLYVLDATPGQWDRIHRGELLLPAGWEKDGAIDLTPAAR
jgi:hypothetical protein